MKEALQQKAIPRVLDRRQHVDSPVGTSQNQGSALKGTTTLFNKVTQFCNLQDWVFPFILHREQRYYVISWIKEAGDL